MLERAIEEGEHDCVQYVLDRLAARCSSVEETCHVLTNYLLPLVDRFPTLVGEYLAQDRFAFEYGRFSAPRSLFGAWGTRPVVMTTDELLGGMDGMDGGEAREFWTRNAKGDFQRLVDSGGPRITAVARWLCVDRTLVRRSLADGVVDVRSKTQFFSENLLHHLSRANVSTSTFSSQALRLVSDWYLRCLHGRFSAVAWLALVNAVVFSFYAVTYGREDEDESVVSKRGVSIALIAISCLLQLGSLVASSLSALRSATTRAQMSLTLGAPQGLESRHHPHPGRAHRRRRQALRLLGLPGVCPVHHAVALGEDRPLAVAACRRQPAFSLSQVARSLQPYGGLAAAVSMARRSAVDAAPLLLLVVLFMIGVASALVVEFDDRFVDSDGDNFDSVLHSCETLFHAVLGNFDEEVRRFRSDVAAAERASLSCVLQVFRTYDDFFDLWRSLLFHAFVVAAIGIAILLVSVLRDTHDRSKLQGSAEKTRCRAGMAGDILFSGRTT